MPATSAALDLRLAQRLAALRTEHGQSLDDLASRSGISRATLSRIERGISSPSANLLGKLCAVFGISMSRLLAEVEPLTTGLIRHAAQERWIDPAAGFVRRTVSPPARDFHIELVEITLPVGAHVHFDAPTIHGTEQHLWLLEGVLDIHLDACLYHLQAGDCLRFHMHGAAHFHCPGPDVARYAAVSCAP